MKVKKTISFNFTEEEKKLIDNFSLFIEDLDADAFEAINTVTKGSDFTEAIQTLWGLAFYENTFNSDD